jgi:hypothetical protein
MTVFACRFCGGDRERSFVDLGRAPLSNAFLTREQLQLAELHYPLHVHVCEACLLVQLEAFESPEAIFGDYLYFSSFSDVWLDHAEAYAARMTAELRLDARSLVVEIASNDGYLLQHFVKSGVPVLGIEPAANVAKVAVGKGIRSEVMFFGRDTAQKVAAKYGHADLLLGNNVLAHVPDLNDFVGGMQILLKKDGLITMEFPHLLRLIEGNQFDTIYHEHFSYFSFLTVRRVFAHHGIELFDVEELGTHGGSLRIYGQHVGAGRPVTERVTELLDRERKLGFETLEMYSRFGEQVRETKRKVLEFLIDAKRAGKSVAGYGAPGKGNTLLNYCGIGPELLSFTVDRSPHKQGRYLPGVQIPIFAPERIAETRPDYVFILPWNIEAEIVEQMSAVRDWGGRFVVPIPRLRII